MLLEGRLVLRTTFRVLPKAGIFSTQAQ